MTKELAFSWTIREQGVVDFIPIGRARRGTSPKENAIIRRLKSHLSPWRQTGTSASEWGMAYRQAHSNPGALKKCCKQREEYTEKRTDVFRIL